MYEIDMKLQELGERHQPIRVALIGAGQMGKEIVSQIALMQGMSVDIVVDLTEKAGLDAFAFAREPAKIIAADESGAASAALERGDKVVSANYQLAFSTPQIDVVIDATGNPEMGARIALGCFHNKKHIVMMNVECDITVGPILRQMAESAGVVYSLTAGDEPGSIIEVYRFAKALGFEIVAAGKGKNNPLNIYATPGDEEWAQAARQRNMNPRMLVEFVDGSKTMIEMCAVSNATGLVPDIRGMHGPECDVEELTSIFCPTSQGGILENTGIVDYGIGNISPGVFVIITTDNELLREGLSQRGMGSGPNYLLYRPYHLCSCETPITVAQAVIYHESTAHPKKTLTSECITVAKRDLKSGEVLDGIGEYCYRASIERASVAKEGNMLPLGLAKGARLNCDVSKDEIITYDMVTFEQPSVLLELRKIQDMLF